MRRPVLWMCRERRGVWSSRPESSRPALNTPPTRYFYKWAAPRVIVAIGNRGWIGLGWPGEGRWLCWVWSHVCVCVCVCERERERERERGASVWEQTTAGPVRVGGGWSGIHSPWPMLGLPKTGGVERDARYLAWAGEAQFQLRWAQDSLNPQDRDTQGARVGSSPRLEANPPECRTALGLPPLLAALGT